MNAQQLFDIWAPTQAVWSRWAKPVLFSEMPAEVELAVPPRDLPEPGLAARPDTAVVVDLPGAASVEAGLALARRGYRPVPLFNGVPGPSGVGGVLSVVDVSGLQAALCRGAGLLQQAELPWRAPPAFLIDALRRSGDRLPSPGRFDNRWLVLPQDFPSAGFLQAEGIRRAVLVTADISASADEDLAHVLLRWQEGGIELFRCGAATPGAIEPLPVRRPTRFRALWYRALVTLGLRRHSAGGFGGIVPQPSSG